MSRSSTSGPSSSTYAAPAAAAAAAWAAREPGPKRKSMASGGASSRTFVPSPARSETRTTTGPVGVRDGSDPPGPDDRGESGAIDGRQVGGDDEQRVGARRLGPGAPDREPLVETLTGLADRGGAETCGKGERLRVGRDDGHADHAGRRGRRGEGPAKETLDERPALLRIEGLAEAGLRHFQAPDGDEDDHAFESGRGGHGVGHGRIVDEARE